MPKARPGATCSDQPAKPIGRYVPESAYYAYKPGLGQGELKLKVPKVKEDLLSVVPLRLPFSQRTTDNRPRTISYQKKPPLNQEGGFIS